MPLVTFVNQVCGNEEFASVELFFFYRKRKVNEWFESGIIFRIARKLISNDFRVDVGRMIKNIFVLSQQSEVFNISDKNRDEKK